MDKTIALYMRLSDEDDNLAEIATLMDDRRLKHVPVVERDTNKLIGLLARRDIILAFFDSVVNENK